LYGSETKLLVDADAAVYAAADQLLFVRQRMLFAQKFDPNSLKLSGNPVPFSGNLSIQTVAASVAGPIVLRTASSASASPELTWFDRSGKEVGKVGSRELNFNAGSTPSLSHDGSRVAILGNLNGNIDIWLVELVRGVFNRFTLDPADEIFPVWSPDD